MPVPSSTLPSLVEPNALGTAFGITACLINALLTVFPIAVGAVIEDKARPGKEEYGYTYEQLLLLGIIAVACASALAFVLDDRYNRGSNVERDPNVKRAASTIAVGMS
jgi:hypothetical protein